MLKIISLTLTAVMLAAVTSACSSTDDGDVPTPSPTPAVLPTPEGDDPIVEPYECTCTEPEGMLAPHDVEAPTAFNSKTPRDTFVVAAGAMSGDFVHGWGSNPYDNSIKVLTGGYKDTYWITSDGQIRLNESVVCNVTTEYDEDWNKTYTFTLHNYLKWSDGTSITAVDYVAGILTYASPAFAAMGGTSSIGDGIKGYEAYRFGAAREESAANDDGQPLTGDSEEPATAATRGEPSAIFEGIDLIDEFTFSATIDAKELPYFWETSLVTFRPVYAAGWFPENTIVTTGNGVRFAAGIDEDLERIAATELFAPTVTCGPYKFVSFVEGSVTLERNEHFGVCPEGYVPYFDKIIQMDTSGESSIDMLRNGSIDFVADVDRGAATLPLETEGVGGAFERIITREAEQPGGPVDPGSGEPGEPGVGGEPGSSDPGSGSEPAPTPEPTPEPPRVFVELSRYPRAGFGFLEFALDFGPTADYNVRRAISYIVNRGEIIENALHGEAVTVDGPHSPAQWTYITRRSEVTKDLPPFFYSIEDANKLLDGTPWRFEADGTTPFDADRASSDGTYLRHNTAGEVLSVVAASSSAGIGGALEEATAEGAAYIGMEFVVEQIDAKTLLDHYYNGKTFSEHARRWHAFQLAADFPPVDDKYWSYHSALAETYLNTNGVRDDELDRLTMAMRSLDPSQTDEYADLWLEFQLRWQEVLPAFPLYCNQYYDGYNNIVTQVPTSAYAGYHDVITHIAKHG